MKENKINYTKAIVFSGVAIALATILANYAKFDLPAHIVNGGSITLFSMLMVCIVGYWYGPAFGLMAEVAHGLIQYFTGTAYVVAPIQIIIDYPLAFGALGLSGFFYKKKHGLVIGYLVGVFGRLFFACLSGIIFYTELVGNFTSDSVAIWGAITYNMAYIVPEVLITLILLCVPPVGKMFGQLKKMARS